MQPGGGYNPTLVHSYTIAMVGPGARKYTSPWYTGTLLHNGTMDCTCVAILEVCYWNKYDIGTLYDIEASMILKV